MDRSALTLMRHWPKFALAGAWQLQASCCRVADTPRPGIQDVLASRPDEVTCARCLRLLVGEAEGRLSRLASTWFSKEAPWTDP